MPGRPTYYDQPMRQTAVWLPQEMIDWLKAQPAGVGETIREMIKKEMTMEVARNLTNPWSGTDSQRMTWEQINAWAEQSVPSTDRHEWLKVAWKAFWADDGETLGKMIVGA